MSSPNVTLDLIGQIRNTPNNENSCNIKAKDQGVYGPVVKEHGI